MNYFSVDGKKYDVIVTSLSESFEVLYSDKTGRTIAVGAPMVLDPLGTFFKHNVTVRRKNGCEAEFDALYKLAYTPMTVVNESDAHYFEIAHEQKTIAYYGYISSGSRALEKIDEKSGKIYWGELSLSITPISAQVMP